MSDKIVNTAWHEDAEVNESIPFNLLHPGTCLVDPIRPSGFTKGGIYVMDQERDMDYKTSMLVRVWGIHPKNKYPEVLGQVCIVPVYTWDDITYNGEVYHLMNEDNLQMIMEGYDDECETIEEEINA